MIVTINLLTIKLTYSLLRFRSENLLESVESLTVDACARYNNTLNDELISRLSMLAEVLFIRDGSYVLPGFDLQDSELRTYINYLSRCG